MTDRSRLAAPIAACCLALALLAPAGAVRAAETPGPNGTYYCWDRCIEGVGCNTACLDDFGDQTTCGQYSASCGSGGGGTVGQRCGDGLCYFDPALGTETPCNCPADCVNSTDSDNDGVPNALESALAARFFPNLWMRWPYSDQSQFYGYLIQIPYTVSPLAGGYGFCGEAFECLEIRYGLAYNWDCGDNPLNGCSGTNNHRGDSEFYALYVSRKDQGPMVWGAPWSVAKTGAGFWRLMADFTSAHLFASTDSSSYMVYKGTNAGGNGYDGPAGGDGSSNQYGIFVSEGKHANYHSIGDCDSGGFLGSDYCLANINVRPYAVAPGHLKNVGSPLCQAAVDSEIPSPGPTSSSPPAYNVPYDIWSGEEFGDSSRYNRVFLMDMLWLRAQSCVYSTPCWEDHIDYAPGENGLRTTWTLMSLCHC